MALAAATTLGASLSWSAVFTGNLAPGNWEGTVDPNDQPSGIAANFAWLGSGDYQQLLITGPTLSYPNGGEAYFTTVRMKADTDLGAAGTRSFPYVLSGGQNDGNAMAFVYRVAPDDSTTQLAAIDVAAGQTKTGVFVLTGLAATDRIMFVLASDLPSGKFNPATLQLVPEPGAFLPGLLLLGFGVCRLARRFPRAADPAEPGRGCAVPP